MSTPEALPAQGYLRPIHRPLPLTAVAAAAVLAKWPPGRLRRALELARRGARPATYAEARAARRAVVAVSVRCAGEGCLQRSIAVALYLRARGAWPTWRTGVRTDPFAAHAWVEAEGRVVDEPFPAGAYQPILTVEPAALPAR